jgi:hypothetical protein
VPHHFLVPSRSLTRTQNALARTQNDASLWLPRSSPWAPSITLQRESIFCSSVSRIVVLGMLATCTRLGGNINRGPGKETLCSGPVAVPSCLPPATSSRLPHWKLEYCEQWVAALEGQTLHICFRHQQRQHSVAGSPEEMDTGATRYSNSALLPQLCPTLRIAAMASVNSSSALKSQIHLV